MIMSYFGLRQWDFKFKNIERLIDETKHFKFDRGHLDFDLKTIDWSEFFKNYIPGIKKYYFRENCENVEKLRVSYDRMKKLHNLLKFLLYGFLSRNIFKAFCALLSKIAFKMINNWIEPENVLVQVFIVFKVSNKKRCQNFKDSLPRAFYKWTLFTLFMCIKKPQMSIPFNSGGMQNIEMKINSIYQVF